MATSAQARLDELSLNITKTQASASKDLSFADKEMLDYRERQKKASQHLPDPATSDDIANDEHASEPQKSIMLDAKKSVKADLPAQQGHLPGTNAEAIVFVPGGIWRGSPAAIQLDVNDVYDPEPASSSKDCIGQFGLFSLVLKFPYKFMQDPGSRVSKRFFAAEKVYERNWDMYYIFGPNSVNGKHLMLVPLYQVRELIGEISREFKIEADVPLYPFQLSFFDDGTPTPQFITKVNSKDDFTEAQSRLPDPPLDHDQIPARANQGQIQDHHVWREKMETAFAAAKAKSKGVRKTKKDQARTLTVTENANQMKRAQRYLGIRPRLLPTQVVGDSLPIEDSFTPIARLEVTSTAPFPFEDETVMVSIDIEAWERDHRIITEIGVSTIDTADLVGLPPGPQGESWIKKIRSRHFRIKGRQQFQNHEFVQGDPNNFQFGASEFVAIDEAAEVIDSCFKHPYSAGFECEGPPGFDENGMPIKRSLATLDTSRSATDENKARKLLLIGHDISRDIDYLSTLSSSIFGSDSGSTKATTANAISLRQRVLSSIRECLDTAQLHKSLSKDDQPRSLARICHDLDIDAFFTHNAGNDARYTLEALIKLVFKARQQEDDAITAGKYDAEKSNYEIQQEFKLRARMDTARRNIEANLAGGKTGSSQGPIFAPAADGNVHRSDQANGADSAGAAAGNQTSDVWNAPAQATADPAVAAESDEEFPY